MTKGSYSALSTFRRIGYFAFAAAHSREQPCTTENMVM